MDTGDRRPVATRAARWARAVAAALTRSGVTPNALSAASVGFAAAAGLAFAATQSAEGPARSALFVVAIAGMQGRLLCNLFDGMVAVEGGLASPTGEIWNDLPDRLSDAAVLVGAGHAANAPTLGWLAAVVALLVAYVRVLGRASGARSHFAGPMAKQHRMALLTGAAGAAAAASAVPAATGAVPTLMFAALWAVVGGGAITAVRRLGSVAADLRAGGAP